MKSLCDKYNRAIDSIRQLVSASRSSSSFDEWRDYFAAVCEVKERLTDTGVFGLSSQPSPAAPLCQIPKCWVCDTGQLSPEQISRYQWCLHRWLAPCLKHVRGSSSFDRRALNCRSRFTEIRNNRSVIVPKLDVKTEQRTPPPPTFVKHQMNGSSKYSHCDVVLRFGVTYKAKGLESFWLEILMIAFLFLLFFHLIDSW